MHYKCNMDWSYNVFIVGTISLGMRLGSSSLISTLGFNRYVHMVPLCLKIGSSESVVAMFTSGIMC